MPKLLEKFISEIIQGATDKNVSVSDLARKALVVASKVGDDEAKAWLTNELNGYAEIEALPMYRKLSCKITIDVRGLDGGGYDNVPYPSLALPKEYRAKFETIHCKIGIDVLEGLLASGNDDLTMDVDANWLHEFSKKLKGGSKCISASRSAGLGTITGIIAAVRNRLVQYAIMLDGEHGEMIKSEESNERDREVLNAHTNNIINFGSMNITAGGGAIDNAPNVTINDKHALEAYLKTLGLNDEQIGEVAFEIEKSHEEAQGVTITERIKTWVRSSMLDLSAQLQAMQPDMLAALIIEAAMQYRGIAR